VGRKAVFSDVDGTFVDDRGVVPPGAREAVVAARANGHEVFSCTGRSMAELWDEIVAPGFDGVIASAGGHVEYEGEVLLHRSVPVADVHRVVGFSDRPGVDHHLEADSGLFGSRHAGSDCGT
jgi:hydroxymethylpyrimidine pyrophosphatase-like HAD family hydrolase